MAAKLLDHPKILEIKEMQAVARNIWHQMTV